jgi:uncharacterized protein YbcI
LPSDLAFAPFRRVAARGSHAQPSRRPSDGTVAGGISAAVVRILHEYTGRGPTKARTDINRESVMVMLADTLTKSERVLVESGKHDLVLQTRQQFQQLMRDDLVAAVEGLTERRVSAFMSENHIDPDLAVEVFVLEPTGDDGPVQSGDRALRSVD